MREIDARVTGFDYTTFHAYTTEVEVDGCTWTVAIRYNTFYQFYTRLVALEKHFTVDFPPKGGLFFSPPPEERQEQLDDFMLSTLAYFDMRGHPKRMEALLGELLQIPEHLGPKEDDGERTASEGSSVAEELLLDTPIAGHHDHNGFLESGHEDDDQTVHDDNLTFQESNQDVEVVLEANQSNPHVDHDKDEVGLVQLTTKPEVVETELEEKSEVPEEKTGEQVVAKIMPSPTPTKAEPMERQQPHELTGDAMAKDYIAMLRRRTFVNGAIQAAVVSTMKENVKKSKAAKADTGEAKEQTPSEAINPPGINKLDSREQDGPTEVEKKQCATPIVADNLAATEAIPMEPSTTESRASALKAPKDVLQTPKEEVGEAHESVVSNESLIEADLKGTSTTEYVRDATSQKSAPVSDSEEPEPTASTLEDSVHESESSSEEESEKVVPEAISKEGESENTVVNWLRRLGTVGASSVEKEEQEAVAEEEQEELEAVATAKKEQDEMVAAAAKEQEEVVLRAAAEAKAKSEAEASEAELLRAEQQLNQRLQPYRHPVFFQGFNCDVGTSRYSLPQRASDGIVV